VNGEIAVQDSVPADDLGSVRGTVQRSRSELRFIATDALDAVRKARNGDDV
jgi:hypothetical protein